MLKSLAVAGSLGALATLAVAPAAVGATWPGYNIQVRERPVVVHHNGYTTGVFWLRCKPGLNAFEYNVGIRQGDVYRSGGELGRNILPCDGTRHRVAVALGGGFHPGPVDISVYVGLNDPDAQGGDISAEGSAHTWLRYRNP